MPASQNRSSARAKETSASTKGSGRLEIKLMVKFPRMYLRASSSGIRVLGLGIRVFFGHPQR